MFTINPISISYVIGNSCYNGKHASQIYYASKQYTKKTRVFILVALSLFRKLMKTNSFEMIY